MRSLQRNTRKIQYAIPLGAKPILDDYGNDTLEVETEYSDPREMYVNISANVGEDAVNTFGSFTEYNRTITLSGIECPLVEGTIVWFGNSRYTVVRVADSKNGFLIALREVTERG